MIKSTFKDMKELLLKRLEGEEIKDLAKKYGWKLRSHWPPLSRLTFSKENPNVKIIVRYGVKSVDTEIYQEKSGRHTTLERPNYTKKLLEEVFINPRVHSGKGRYIRTYDFIKKLKITQFS